jgi:subtilisin family serine protease
MSAAKKLALISGILSGLFFLNPLIYSEVVAVVQKEEIPRQIKVEMKEGEVLVKYKAGSRSLSIEELKSRLASLEKDQKKSYFLVSILESLARILGVSNTQISQKILSDQRGIVENIKEVNKVITQDFNELKLQEEIQKRFAGVPTKILDKEGISSKRTKNIWNELERWQKIKFKQSISFEEIKETLEKLPEIEKVSPNFKYQTLQTEPNDEFFKTKGSWGQSFDDLWGLKSIKGPEAWSLEKGSPLIAIAVVDTGVDERHPDLGGNVLTTLGWDFVDQDNIPQDGFGHGSHVAGTIAAMTNNKIGVAGVCWNCKILPVKGLNDQGWGSTDSLASSIVYATLKGAKVINMSWGGFFKQDPFLDEALDFASAAGVILVAAAGNESMNTSWIYPANRHDVVAVGAVNHNLGLTWFSNFGPKTFIVAPGEEILSIKAKNTNMGGCPPKICPVVKKDYIVASGTSMSAPHVSGLIGLMLSRNHSLTPGQVRAILNQFSQDLGEEGRDNRYGAGLIDAGKAVLNSLTPPPINNKPDKPSISGPSELLSDQRGDFTITLSDPENDQKQVLVMWQQKNCSFWCDVNEEVIKVQPGVQSITYSRAWTIAEWDPDIKIYNVWVTVFDQAGNASLPSDEVILTIKKPAGTNRRPNPPLAFTGPTNLFTEEVGRFQLYGSDPDKDKVKVVFDWGDGSITETDFKESGSLFEAIHAYQSPGSYIIGAYVIDEKGATSFTIGLTVKVSRRPLEVSCQTEPASAFPNQLIRFVANVKGGLPPYKYVWKGACRGQSAICENSFSRPGTYTANLVVVDADKESKIASCKVTILPPPELKISCSATPNPAKIKETVTFSSTVNGGVPPYTFLWRGACSGTNPSCSTTFSSSGTYTATLTVKDSTYLQKSTSCSVTVRK